MAQVPAHSPGIPSGAATSNPKPEMMTLYNHSKHRSQGRARWSEFQDPVAEEKRLQELGKTFAIIHRLSKVEKDGLVSWVTTSLEAQSPRLRKVLDTIFHDYPSWYADGSPYAVAPPFKPYVHRWEAFSEAWSQSDTDERTSEELQHLRRELESRIDGHLSALGRVKKTGVVSFENLWMILNPGCFMISRSAGPTQVFKFIQATFSPATHMTPAMYELTLAYVDWNGACCGFSTTSKEIVEYEDSISVTKLPVYPVEFAAQWKEIEPKLIARGRKFERLRGYHMKMCQGKKYVKVEEPYPKIKEQPVSGRVIIDAYAYYKVQNKVAPVLFPLADSLSGRYPPPPGPPGNRNQRRRRDPRYNSSDDSHSSGSSSSETGEEMSPHPRRIIPRRPGPQPVRINCRDAEDALTDESDNNVERKEDMRPLTDVECVIASPRAKGFDLNAKEWCEFDVDDIKDVVWDDSPYDNLVLPDGERELVFAFANRPRFSKQGFDDFVSHKGEGIIILLAGPPGVGKTLTAESVAEKSRVPLYIVSASDLGTKAEGVEKGLTAALECCQLWDAVLLIDEADVFLESRDSNNLERNELVSIFLRRLEYYRGLMFLTTNRITAIDNAVKSRIDLILPYLELDEQNRRKVWVNFLQKLKPGIASISDSDLDELAKTPLNGREIKNSIKTALVLANTDKPLGLKHLKVVLGIRNRALLLDQHD
ncbi:P-loop containing nucleoside triphosphate hydrolase protein [Xylaria longipes]|nr:P-loop containing nucleoside triphosphate hydrolase protein [Xylaria longipes]